MTEFKTRTDRMSKGILDDSPYDCKYKWPITAFLQGGRSGMVFTKGTFKEALEDPEKSVDCITSKTDHYRTCYFEAFPRDPDTFIRGEGSTMEEAEEQAWKKFQKQSGCTDHQFLAKGYENGGAFCVSCNLFQCVFPPKPTTYEEIMNTVVRWGLLATEIYTKEQLENAPRHLSGWIGYNSYEPMSINSYRYKQIWEDYKKFFPYQYKESIKYRRDDHGEVFTKAHDQSN